MTQQTGNQKKRQRRRRRWWWRESTRLMLCKWWWRWYLNELKWEKKWDPKQPKIVVVVVVIDEFIHSFIHSVRMKKKRDWPNDKKWRLSLFKFSEFQFFFLFLLIFTESDDGKLAQKKPIFLQRAKMQNAKCMQIKKKLKMMKIMAKFSQIEIGW